MSGFDWYCDEVIPGISTAEVLLDTATALAIRPDRPGFSVEHIIVVPKRHVPSLLDLDPSLAHHLLTVVQQMARGVTDQYGGCQVIVSVGDEQHNHHLHIHVGAG